MRKRPSTPNTIQRNAASQCGEEREGQKGTECKAGQRLAEHLPDIHDGRAADRASGFFALVALSTVLAHAEMHAIKNDV